MNQVLFEILLQIFVFLAIILLLSIIWISSSLFGGNFSFIPGDNSYVLLSILVKHLDHKSTVKKPQIQMDIINVTTQLAQNAKPQASVTIIGAIADLIKHLRKCLLCSSEASSTGHDTDKWNTDLQLALENCISELSKKVCFFLFFFTFIMIIGCDWIWLAMMKETPKPVHLSHITCRDYWNIQLYVWSFLQVSSATYEYMVFHFLSYWYTVHVC